MARLKKTILLLAGCSVLVLLLIGGAELALPRLVNLEAVRQAVVSAIQTHVDGEASFELLNVSLFPRPHLTVHELKLTRDDSFTAKIDAVRVTVDALPLLRGQLRVRRIHLSDPRLSLFLEPDDVEEPPAGAGTGEGLSYRGMRRGFVALLAPAISIPGGLVVTVEDGVLEVHHGPSHVNRFRQIDGRMARSGSQVQLAYSCRSDLWRQAKSETFLDIETFKGRSTTTIDGLNPNVLSRILYPESPFSFPEHDVTLSVQLVSSGPADLDLSFRATVPKLDVAHAGQTTALRGASIEGDITARSDGFRITLGSVTLQQPALKAGGTLTFDPQSGQMVVDVQGTGIDAGAVRQCALVLAGDHEDVVKTFEVIRGGFVPQIRFQVQGKTLEDLGKLRNMIFTGSMVDGKLYIEPADLELEGAEGDAVIEGGILQGRRLKARAGATTGRDGSLTLALKKDSQKDGPFHLDIEVDADLSRLPAVLLHCVKDPEFLEELRLMSDIQGRAKGRLILGETLKKVKTRVEAREFKLQGRYQRIPFPIEVQGGALTFVDKSVSIAAFSGTLGKSSWEPLDLTVDWGPTSRIAVRSTNPLQASLDQIFPWLTSYDPVKRAFPDIQGLKGDVTLTSSQLEGPLFQPAQWHYEVKGRFLQGTVESGFFPAPVTVRSAGLSAVPASLVLTDCQATLLDAPTTLTVVLKTQKGLTAVDLTIADATVGPKVTQWLVDLIRLPGEFRPRPPVSLAKSRFTWERDGRVGFSGTLAQPGGAQAAIEYEKKKDQWSLNRLAIKDGLSNGVIRTTVRERDLDLSFQGNLDGRTLDDLLASNEVLKGGVFGDLRIHVLVDEPIRSTASGMLDLRGFRSLWRFKAPVEIDRAAFEAQGNRLSVKSADIAVSGNKLRFSGDLTFAASGLAMDMAVTSEAVAWKTEEPNGDDASKRAGAASTPEDATAEFLNPRFMGLPLTGLLRLSFDRLDYGRYSFTPFRAEVQLRPGVVKLETSEAKLCGVSLPGELLIGSDKVSLLVRPNAVKEPLEPAIVCLGGKKAIIDGVFNLGGELRAEGSRDALVRSLRGNVEFDAREGRIYRFDVVSKIFSVINVTEIYRGQLPDLANQGCAYDSITVKAGVEEGKLNLEEAVVDGRCMKMVWSGTLDFVSQKLDMVVLLAPLRTFERLIGYVPLIGSIFEGVISIPVKVSGDLSDPSIVPMSPSALGSKLVGIMKQVLRAPLKIMSPFAGPQNGASKSPDSSPPATEPWPEPPSSR